MPGCWLLPPAQQHHQTVNRELIPVVSSGLLRADWGCIVYVYAIHTMQHDLTLTPSLAAVSLLSPKVLSQHSAELGMSVLCQGSSGKVALTGCVCMQHSFMSLARVHVRIVPCSCTIVTRLLPPPSQATLLRDIINIKSLAFPWLILSFLLAQVDSTACVCHLGTVGPVGNAC